MTAREFAGIEKVVGAVAIADFPGLCPESELSIYGSRHVDLYTDASLENSAVTAFWLLTHCQSINDSLQCTRISRSTGLNNLQVSQIEGAFLRK